MNLTALIRSDLIINKNKLLELSIWQKHNLFYKKRNIIKINN